MSLRASVSLEQSVPLSQGTTRAKGARIFLKIVYSCFLSKELWLQNILSFLVARAGVLGDLYPFGPALFVAILVVGERRRAVAAAICITIGYATVLPVDRVVGLMAVMIVALVASAGVGRMGARRRSAWHGATLVTVAILFGIARIIPQWYGGDLVGVDAVSALVETVLILLTAIMLMPAAAVNWLDAEEYNSRTLLALGFMMAVSGLGLSDVSWGPFIASEVWHRFVTLFAALIGGAAGGAAMGTGVGGIAALTGWLPLGGMGLYGVSGLLAGLFAKRGKTGIVLGCLLGHLTLAVHAGGTDELVGGAVHTVLAVGLLLLVPGRWVVRLQRSIPGSEAQSALRLAREQRLRAAIRERLDNVSSVFSELADVFSRGDHSSASTTNVEDGIHAIVEDVWHRHCHQCRQFTACWERNFYTSYWETVDLIATAERKGRATVSDLSPGMKKRCIQAKEYVSAMNAARQSNGGGHWSLEKAAAMDVVPYQLRGAAALVERVADQVSVETGRAQELESRLWEEFSLRRVRVGHVRVAETGNHPEIEVEYTGECDGYGACAVPLLAAVETQTGRSYSCELSCRSGLEQTCHVHLTPEPALDLHVDTAQLAKKGTGQSGDTSTRVDLDGGKVALLLSDGMGSGKRAALESQATVGMLEKMMKAGFDRSFSVRTINSVLLLRSTDDVFATLDMVIIDRFTGDAQFLKVGSSPTFIKRGRDVEIIRSESLPIGILHDIDFKENTYHLNPGDVLVMMTDGILDAFPDQADKEEWIARMLRRVETTEPNELVQLIVKRAKQAANGSVRDDMTVIVARLEAK